MATTNSDWQDDSDLSDDDDLLDDDDFDGDVADDYTPRPPSHGDPSELRKRARTRKHPENWDDDWQDPEDDLMYGFSDEEE